MNNIKPLVIVGPSGVGKSTIISLMLKTYPNKFGYSVSHTSRKIRQGEINGINYYFTTKSEIEDLIKQDKVIEYANVHGNLYATSKEAVKKVIDEGKICIIEIDIQGVIKIRNQNFDANYIFIDPPSFEELEKRLKNRQTENENEINIRLNNAKKEIEQSHKPGLIDLHVISENNNIENCVKQIIDFIDKY